MSMTPEERANAIINSDRAVKAGRQAGMTSDEARELGAQLKLVEAEIASALRQVEREAYERALARLQADFDDAGSEEQNSIHGCMMTIRALIEQEPA